MSDNIQEGEVLRQIEREVRMREGASKLLAACSRREQALEASKSLLTCSARILALLSQLQRMRKAQILQRVGHRPSEEAVPSLGKVSLSDLRVPLMWKDSEYFKNKGELQRCAVFCLLQCGTEIHDTDVLRVELYSSSAVEDFSPGTLGPRRSSRLGGSVGCSSGKKIRAAFESAAVCGANVGAGSVSPPLSPDLSTLGPKFNLLAHATLTLEHVQEGFKTHDLSLAATEDDPFWLPLYGSMCCRLVAQPLCMIQPIISGQLKYKLGEDLNCWGNGFSVLRGQHLLCYQSQEDMESEDKPFLEMPITQDIVVCVSERDPDLCQTVNIITWHQGEEVTFRLTPPSPEDTQRWTEAIWQHIYNLSRWKQCCHHLMKIETQGSKKAIPARQGSLYHEIVTPSAPGEGHVIPDLSVEICALLSSYYKER
ncbi:hypothetical protein JOQ06_008060 [Pogonophryne albipinna]|uniref:Rhotekin n=1 Tax=Pogonophryne albipinna TaxID=1090488 RepID=A0AAD6F8R3_9TELE|nr:hypothetical protein JOQ06_008060 [Pogonophryne albipinna]